MVAFLRAARHTTMALWLAFGLFFVLYADCSAEQSGVIAWRHAHAVMDRMLSQHMLTRTGVSHNHDKKIITESYSVREYDLRILFVYDEAKSTWGLAFIPTSPAMKEKLGDYGVAFTSTTCYRVEVDDPFILSVQAKIVSHR